MQQRNLFISFAVIKKGKKLFKTLFIQSVLLFFANCLSKNVLRIIKVSHFFALDKANRLEKVYIVPKKLKHSFNPPLLYSCNRNNTVCGYVNLKYNTAQFQRSEVAFPVGILVHLNELQEGARIIQNLKKRKTKWPKNCPLEL